MKAPFYSPVARNGFVRASFLGLTAALFLLSSGSAQQDRKILFERIFRSELVSVTPVYAEGRAGDSNAIVGLDTRANLMAIGGTLRGGILPSQSSASGRVVGHTTASIRLPAGVFLDKTKEIQIASGTGTFVADADNLRFEFSGTVIVRWVQDDSGNYTGIRWTDFSAGITKFEGKHEGSRGHFLGTRLLVGDPEITSQSGIIIYRLFKD
jgi:hypothetical protein